jgi:NAD/NADP transhydrogenase alpha subunit
MSVNSKHLATILLGAAAAYGAYKYNKMTDEEKKKLADSFKDKFHKLKDEAENAAGNAKSYFSDLKNKVTDLFKEHFPGAEKHFDEFFDKNAKESAQTMPATELPPGA